MKTMSLRCDRGGCLNHVGSPCSMDDSWETASELAKEELDPAKDTA